MKEFKAIVGFILLALSVLLFYQFGLNVWFLATSVSTFGELWMDLGLYLIAGVLIMRYSWQLIFRSLRIKKRSGTLDEGELIDRTRKE